VAGQRERFLFWHRADRQGHFWRSGMKRRSWICKPEVSATGHPEHKCILLLAITVIVFTLSMIIQSIHVKSLPHYYGNRSYSAVYCNLLHTILLRLIAHTTNQYRCRPLSADCIVCTQRQSRYIKETCLSVCYSIKWKSTQRRKHCAMHVVRWSQKFSPRLRPPSRSRRTAKFNQLEMVRTFTYRTSLVKIDARNFELSW